MSLNVRRSANEYTSSWVLFERMLEVRNVSYRQNFIHSLMYLTISKIFYLIKYTSIYECIFFSSGTSNKRPTNQCYKNILLKLLIKKSVIYNKPLCLSLIVVAIHSL